MKLEKLYPIVDRAVLEARGIRVLCFAGEMARAGVGMVQYRDKDGRPQAVLRAAEEISRVFAGMDATLVMNDRADLAVLAGWGGVHVGQKDLSACDARRVLRADKVLPQGLKPASSGKDMKAKAEALAYLANAKTGAFGEGKAKVIVGVSTHGDGQVVAADAGCADYVAVGPVFATGSKADAEAVIGLEGVRRARALTTKPIVAIGGITRENARSVMEAGADSVAVIGGLLVKGERPGKVAEDFLEILR
jgi:thiamine-phosphate pyrophosphorylase